MMLRPILNLAFAAAAVSLQPGQGVHIKKYTEDPRFQQKVTLRLEHEPIQDAIKALSKAAGQTFEASNNIEDMKVDVFVHDLPAGLVMDKIASVLDCEWHEDKGFIDMEMSSTESKKMDQLTETEDEDWRQDAQARANLMAESSGGTYTEFVQAMNEHPEPIIPAGASSGDGPGALHANTMIYRQMLGASPQAYAIGQLFHTWGDSEWSSFWQGEVAYEPMQGGPHPIHSHAPRNAKTPPSTPTNMVFGRYDENGSHDLEITVTPSGSPPRTFSIPTDMRPEGKASQTEFAKEAASWDNLADSTDPVLDTQVPADKATDAPPSTESLFGGRVQKKPTVTATDRLAALADRANIQIIADSYRIPAPLDLPVAAKAPTVKGWASSMHQGFGCYVRAEDGVLMVRHPAFWRLRYEEIPESAIASLAQQKGKITFTDYLGFAATLTDAQAATLKAENPPVLGFDTEPIKNAIPAMKFLASVNSSPQPGLVVPYSSLGGDAKSLYAKALFLALFSDGLWKGQGPNLVSSARDSFAFETAEIESPNGLAPGLALIFGTSKTDCIEYDVLVAG